MYIILIEKKKKRRFINVFFATLLQLCDMMERRRDLKKITLPRRHDVVCQLDTISLVEFQ